MSRSQSLTIGKALEKLHNASKAAGRRGDIKLHERTRVREALSLLANGRTDTSLGIRARSTYLAFLRNVEKTSGLSMVVLCAFGLGKSAIGFLTETVRLDLPFEIQKELDKLDNEVLQTLAEGYSVECRKHALC